MKTNLFINRKAHLYYLIGFLGLFVTSCGSYQNSSYYENDGIYGTNGEKIVIKETQSNPSAVQYKEYFNSLQNTNQSPDIFTDVNDYNNNYNTENDSIQAPNSGYASWGSSPQETTVTVYPDSYWSIGFGFGWGYPYYGYGYGWGYPYYGYGYPYYGYGYPYYGYGGSYSYNSSRRGSSYGGGYNTTTPYNRNYTDRNGNYSRNNISSTGRNSYTNSKRTSPTFTNRNSNTTSRNYQGQNRNSYNQTRTNTNSTSRQNYSPSNSYSPSTNNSYRNSGGGMSSGSSRMSGGGGGSRMSSGGGRR